MSFVHASHTDREIAITRIFDAPRELVFKVWTDEKHLASWFGPRETTISSSRLDLRHGGTYLYAMQSRDGSVMWAKWTFREIAPPDRLVMVIAFSDEQGGLTRHPMAPTWPREMLAVVTFAEHAGIGHGTVVTVTTEALDASEAERATFRAGFDSMTQGWGGTLDRLTAHLEHAAKGMMP